MEIEQLVGMIRHMRAQKQALDCMDEVLTVVMEKDARVKELERLARVRQVDLDAMLATKAGLEASFEHARHEQQAILAATAADAEVAMKKHLADLMTRTDTANARVKDAHNAEAALVAACSELAQRRAGLLQEVAHAEQALKNAHESLAAFKAAL